MNRESRQFLASARPIPPSSATPLPSDLVNGPIPSFERPFRISRPTAIPNEALHSKAKVRLPRLRLPGADVASENVSRLAPLNSVVEVRRTRSRSPRRRSKEAEPTFVGINPAPVDTVLPAEKEPLLSDANPGEAVEVQTSQTEAVSTVNEVIVSELLKVESQDRSDLGPVAAQNFSETDVLDLWIGLLGAIRPPEVFSRRARSVEEPLDTASEKVHRARFSLPDILFEGDVPGRVASTNVDDGTPEAGELFKGRAGAKLRQWAHSREMLLVERSQPERLSTAIAGSNPTATPVQAPTPTPTPTHPQLPSAARPLSLNTLEDQMVDGDRSLDVLQVGVSETSLEDLWAPSAPTIRLIERDPLTVLVQWDLGPIQSHSAHQQSCGTSSEYEDEDDRGRETKSHDGIQTGKTDDALPAATWIEPADGGIPEYRIRVYFEGPGSVAQVEHRIPPATDHHVIRKESGSMPYAAELGYTTHEGQWVCVAGSANTIEPESASVPYPPEENVQHHLSINEQRVSDGQIGTRSVQPTTLEGETRSVQAIDLFQLGRGAHGIGGSPHFERMDAVQVGSLVPTGIQAERLRRIVFDTETWGESFESSHWMGKRDLERFESVLPPPAENAPSSADLPRLMEGEAVGISSAVPVKTGVSDHKTTGVADRSFWFRVNAEVVLYGSTEPDACVAIGGRPVKLRADGSFSFRFILPDGRFVLPVVARSADGVEERSAAVTFSRETQFVGEVDAHPQDPSLRPPDGGLE